MQRINTVIVGAGQCGLAASRELSRRSVDHIVIEQGRIGESWLRQRWDSLRLLTPNWLNGILGQSVRDPDGYMRAREFAELLARGADQLTQPVMTGTRVRTVKPWGGGHLVQTEDAGILCDNVVLAAGGFARPRIAVFASDLPDSVHQVSALTYCSPGQLPDGAVMVVGASASGLQIARELALSGRRVILAVGQHARLPRWYRGADILTWMHLIGVLDVPFTKVDDLNRVRAQASLPLLGHYARLDLDLNTLQSQGVEVVGRLATVTDGRAWFSGALAHVCTAADLKMNRLLDRIDAWVTDRGLGRLVDPSERFAATRLPEQPMLHLDVRRGVIAAVVWATGALPDHRFVDEPVFDAKGRIRHTGGVVGNGLYVMGLPYLRTVRSTHISGAEREARALARHLAGRLGRPEAA
jgi:putative flavoprotein involved in K+ transport